jgi:hypothetical protein
MTNPCGTNPSTATDATALPPERAFVVEFSSGGATRLSGRVEHVVSGQAVRFESPGELLEFMRSMLRAHEGGTES